MEPHAPTQVTGKIIVPGSLSMSCTIMDISDKGAVLKVSSVLGIPDSVYLLIGTSQVPRECKILHKAPNRIEVLFR